MKKTLESVLRTTALAGALGASAGVMAQDVGSSAREANASEVVDYLFNGNTGTPEQIQKDKEMLDGVLENLYEARPELRPEDEGVKLSGDLRYSLGEDGFYSQNLFTIGTGDLTSKVFLGTTPHGHDLGAELKEARWKVNAGYSERNDEGQGHIAGNLIFDDVEDSYLGATAQFRPDGDTIGTFFGSWDFGDDRDRIVEGTFDTEGNWRVVGIAQTGENSHFGGHFGVNPEGEYDAGVSWNNENIWANVRFGDSRNLDAQFFFGDIQGNLPGITRNALSTQLRGFNDLSDFLYHPDQTFQFDIGSQNLFDYFRAYSGFLGWNPGNVAFGLRLKQNELFRAEGAYRIGNVGPLESAYVGAGVDLGLNEFDRNGSNQYLIQVGGNVPALGKGVEVAGQVRTDGDDTSAGVYLRVEF